MSFSITQNVTFSFFLCEYLPGVLFYINFKLERATVSRSFDSCLELRFIASVVSVKLWIHSEGKGGRSWPLYPTWRPGIFCICFNILYVFLAWWLGKGSTLYFLPTLYLICFYTFQLDFALQVFPLLFCTYLFSQNVLHVPGISYSCIWPPY